MTSHYADSDVKWLTWLMRSGPRTPLGGNNGPAKRCLDKGLTLIVENSTWHDLTDAGRDVLAQYRADRDLAPANPFQSRVRPWMRSCFGAEIANDRQERSHRFIEEALELIQATGLTKDEVLQLVDYVFSRPVGEPSQEVGGVMVTLAALCLAQDLDMHKCGETELTRIWGKVDVIRAKQAAKPKSSPLPQKVS